MFALKETYESLWKPKGNIKDIWATFGNFEGQKEAFME